MLSIVQGIGSFSDEKMDLVYKSVFINNPTLQTDLRPMLPESVASLVVFPQFTGNWLLDAYIFSYANQHLKEPMEKMSHSQKLSFLCQLRDYLKNKSNLNLFSYAIKKFKTWLTEVQSEQKGIASEWVIEWLNELVTLLETFFSQLSLTMDIEPFKKELENIRTKFKHLKDTNSLKI
jgi:hypothetical protein